MWIQGSDDKNNFLTLDQIKDDISPDHMNNTVTYEYFPNFKSLKIATIHPCKHAYVINKFYQKIKDPKKELYLLLFLKLIQSAIPTINYEFEDPFTFISD